MQSIAKQYHILPSEQGNMHYSDWLLMVGGLMEDTPLGQIVQIRSENNKEMLKHFTPYENRIRREWSAFRAKKQLAEKSPQQINNDIAAIEAMIKAAFGGGE